MMRFLKDWILPIAMAAGAGGYFLFHYAGFLAPLKPAVWVAVDILTPSLIFIQLFLTFCKIDLKDMRLTGWHWTILAFQAFSALLMAAVLMFVPMNEVYREIFEGAMVCLICPTATAAAVVTDKLGGSAARITLYNLMSNILAAVFVPVVFPVLWMIAGAALLTCIVQFWFGKRTGKALGDTITAGQALGQKNSVLAIWMAYTYLNPISSLAPGTYAIWQNIFNSWQLWRKNHRDCPEK